VNAAKHYPHLARPCARRNAGHAASKVALSYDDALVFSGSFKLKTAAEDFSVVPPFEIRSGAEQRVPFLFNSPHSGRYYPERFLAMARLDRNAIRRSEDCYVDELFGGAVALGAPMLAANFPRAYLDVNREPWELDPRMFAEPVPSFCNIRSARVAGGLGTVPKLVGEGLDIYSGRLPLAEAVARIEAVYKPYHETLKRLLTRTHARFGFAVLIDCHSMPASIRVGDSGLRPDFIIGDRFGISATAALTETAIGLLTAMGYTVAHNKPYAGGFITEHYGRPARHLHALQIEVNRGLYMNERTFEKVAGFDALADDLTRFSADLMAMPDHHFIDLPLAAE
jgi:N-formylglutamate amidohydrolase